MFYLMSLALIWFLVVTIPGPNFFLVIQYSMSTSRKSGVLGALGVSIGAGVWTTTSLLGLSLVFSRIPWLYNFMRIAGALYLFYFGASIIRSSFHVRPLIAKGKEVKEKTLYFLQKGLLTSLSNPKTAVFFTSIFVATLPKTTTFIAYCSIVAMIFTISFLWYGLVACFFSLMGIQNFYKKMNIFIDIGAGSLFIMFSIFLSLEVVKQFL